MSVARTNIYSGRGDWEQLPAKGGVQRLCMRSSWDAATYQNTHGDHRLWKRPCLRGTGAGLKRSLNCRNARQDDETHHRFGLGVAKTSTTSFSGR